VRVTSDSGFDRVAFEFADSLLPGYQISTRKDRSGGAAPAMRSRSPVGVDCWCGSNRRRHDERGNSTVPNREWAPAAVVQEMKLVCDFEGQVEWAIGLSARRRFRVIETAPSAHLLVDVRH
jgi:hypothetical protein